VFASKVLRGRKEEQRILESKVSYAFFSFLLTSFDGFFQCSMAYLVEPERIPGNLRNGAPLCRRGPSCSRLPFRQR
jgi:hypothetical protein